MRLVLVGLMAAFYILPAHAQSITIGGNQDSDDAFTNYVRPGIAAGINGNYDRDIADQTTALGLMPRMVAAHYERGIAYLHESKWDNAIADMTAVIKAPPSSQRPQNMVAAAYQFRGDAYGAKGDLPNALADYNQALNFNPRDAFTLNSRGMVYFNQKSYDAAIADYTAALQINPKLAGALYGRGLAEKIKGNPKAAQDLADAKAMDPQVEAMFGG